MHVYGQITGALSSGATITGTLSAGETLSGSLTIPAVILPASYPGPTTITPSAEAQTLETAGFYMREDITIEPIPSNYGLITWDGAVITVS